MSVLSRHRQLLGGTHDYDGRRILKRRKSADKAGSFRGTGGKAGPQPSIAEDDEEEGQSAPTQSTDAEHLENSLCFGGLTKASNAVKDCWMCVLASPKVRSPLTWSCVPLYVRLRLVRCGVGHGADDHGPQEHRHPPLQGRGAGEPTHEGEPLKPGQPLKDETFLAFFTRHRAVGHNLSSSWTEAMGVMTWQGVEEENRLLRETVEALKTRLCLAETQVRPPSQATVHMLFFHFLHEKRFCPHTQIYIQIDRATCARDGAILTAHFVL